MLERCYVDRCNSVVEGALSCLRGGLTDDDVTSLLTSLLPIQRQQRRQSRCSRPASNASQVSRNSTTALHVQLPPAASKGF